MNKFGNRLKHLMLDKKINQIKLAEKLGLSNSAISDWTNGRSYPNALTLIQLVEILEVSADFILGTGYGEKTELINPSSTESTQYQSVMDQDQEIIHLKEKIELLVKQTENQECIIKLLNGEVVMPKKLPKKLLNQIQKKS
jgi:transcriptional regulator with XRE-family HTH domain